MIQGVINQSKASDYVSRDDEVTRCQSARESKRTSVVTEWKICEQVEFYVTNETDIH
jgi:hypothetical protein